MVSEPDGERVNFDYLLPTVGDGHPFSYHEQIMIPLFSSSRCLSQVPVLLHFFQSVLHFGFLKAGLRIVLREGHILWSFRDAFSQNRPPAIHAFKCPDFTVRTNWMRV